MKINSNTKLTGRHVILVPYKEIHVPKYHTWMKSEELQKLTASMPLTLEEEYEMQKSWRNDEDKCTFIILEKKDLDQNNDEIDSMIGDTNIFIIDKENAVGEIEIMIAENSARGKKFGTEAVNLMFAYTIKYLNLKKFVAKISLSNDISINLFKKLGFHEKSVSDVFQEITLEKEVTDDWIQLIDNEFPYSINIC